MEPLEAVDASERELDIQKVGNGLFNPYLTNRFSHLYQLGKSTSVLRGIRCEF